MSSFGLHTGICMHTIHTNMRLGGKKINIDYLCILAVFMFTFVRILETVTLSPINGAANSPPRLPLELSVLMSPLCNIEAKSSVWLLITGNN